MNRVIKFMLVVMVLVTSSAVFLCGCGDKSGGTIDEPDITGDYLTDEYANQLLTDGAETILGFVTITKNEDSSYSVKITEKEIIPSADYDEGYYVADTNREMNLTLGTSGRIACLDGDEIVVKTADEFIEDLSNMSLDEMHIYTVYTMGDSVELITETRPEDVEME